MGEAQLRGKKRNESGLVCLVRSDNELLTGWGCGGGGVGVGRLRSLQASVSHRNEQMKPALLNKARQTRRDQNKEHRFIYGGNAESKYSQFRVPCHPPAPRTIAFPLGAAHSNARGSSVQFLPTYEQCFQKCSHSLFALGSCTCICTYVSDVTHINASAFMLFTSQLPCNKHRQEEHSKLGNTDVK